VIFSFFSTFLQANPKSSLVSRDKSVEDSSDEPESLGKFEPSNPEEKPNSSRQKKTKKPSPELTLEQLEKKKEVLTKVLKFGSHKERKDAMREVVRFPKEHAEELYQIISQILSSDTDMGIKISCLRALAEVQYKKEPEIIISSLKDKSDDVKEAGVFAIQKLKLEEASEDLVKLLKEQDFTKNQNLTHNGIAALSELESGKIGFEFLESKFREKTTHNNIRASIALYFGKMKDIRAESVLQDVLVDESEDPMTRAYAANSLGKINSQNSVPKIREVLEKINEIKNKFELKRLSNLKMYCIGALVALGDSEIMKELVYYAKDDDANIRIRAIKQLAEIDTPEILELLEYKAQRDPSKKVQEVAKKILEDKKKKEEADKEEKLIRPISPR
jgi:HEAT repeat protein